MFNLSILKPNQYITGVKFVTTKPFRQRKSSTMGVVIKRVFCLDLPTAGLVIGFLGVFGGVWEIIEKLVALVYFDDHYGSLDDDIKSTAYIMLVSVIVACIVELLTSILLLLGTHKKSHNMLLPWLILKGICLAVLIPIASISVICEAYFVFHGHGAILLAKSFGFLLATALYSYIFMIIYSLYHYIRDEIQKPNLIDAEKLYNNSNIQYNTS